MLVGGVVGYDVDDYFDAGLVSLSVISSKSSMVPRRGSTSR